MPLNAPVPRIVDLFFIAHPKGPIANRQIGFHVLAIVTNSGGRPGGNVTPVRPEDNEISVLTFNELIFRSHDVKNVSYAAFKAESIGEADIDFLSRGHHLRPSLFSA